MVKTMLDAGKYKYQITIYEIKQGKDNDGFPTDVEVVVLQPYAYVKTTKGFTLISNNSDFEKALTNFTIRYSQTVEDAYYNSNNSNRDLLVKFRNKSYKVLYLNNIDEANVEIEITNKDFDTIISNCMKKLLGDIKSVLSGSSVEKNMEKYLTEELKNEQPQMKTVTKTIELVKEDKKWKVVSNDELIDSLLPGFQEAINELG